MNKTLPVLGILIALIGVYLIASLKTDAPSLGGNAYQATRFDTASTTNIVSVTASTRILATTTTGKTRVYARICNDSATKIVLNLNADAPVVANTSGFPLAANTCYDINDQNLYQGAIQASSTAGAVNVAVTSFEL